MSKGREAHPSNSQIVAVQRVICRLVERMSTMPPNYSVRFEVSTNRWVTLSIMLVKNGTHHINNVVTWGECEEKGTEYAERMFDLMLETLEGHRDA